MVSPLYQPYGVGNRQEDIGDHLPEMADRYVGTYAWDAVDLDAVDLFTPGEVLESHGDEIDLMLAVNELLAQALHDLGPPREADIHSIRPAA